jgi:hypothetical protein
MNRPLPATVARAWRGRGREATGVDRPWIVRGIRGAVGQRDVAGRFDKALESAFVTAYRSIQDACTEPRAPRLPPDSDDPIPCGTFRPGSRPCIRPAARRALLEAALWLEAQAPSTAKGWPWQQSWQGLYALIVDGKLAEA